MEDFVPFEIANKLKEKGYPQHIADDAYIIDNYGEDKYNIGDRLPIPFVPDYMDDVAAPTISQVLKWLREKGIDIYCTPNWYNKTDRYYVVCIVKDRLYNYGGYIDDNEFNTYEEAALAGIEYVLDNLI